MNGVFFYELEIQIIDKSGKIHTRVYELNSADYREAFEQILEAEKVSKYLYPLAVLDPQKTMILHDERSDDRFLLPATYDVTVFCEALRTDVRANLFGEYVAVEAKIGLEQRQTQLLLPMRRSGDAGGLVPDECKGRAVEHWPFTRSDAVFTRDEQSVHGKRGDPCLD